MNEHLQARYTSARAPSSPVQLAPPLALRWSLKGGVPATGLPVVKGDFIVAFQGDRSLAVCLDSKGRVRWRLPLTSADAAIVDDQVLIGFERDKRGGLLVTDLATGKAGREEAVEQGFSVVVRGGFIERCWPDPSVRLRTLAHGCPIRWTHSFGDGADGTRVDLKIAAADDTCFVAVALGGETRVAALNLENGKQVWSFPVHDIDEPASANRWNPAIAQGLLIMGTANGTAALDVEGGKLTWQSRIPALRTVYGDRVYLKGSNPEAPGQPSRIVVLNARNGQLVWQRDYPEVLKKGRDNRLTGHLAVSETHLFAGDDRGAIWAFGARDGEPIWSHRPEGSQAFAPWTLPVAVDGRLFIASAGDRSHLFCYEQAQPADAAKASDEGADELAGVEFRIDKVHLRQELTRSKPFFAPGGGWTVLSCRLAPKGGFFLAIQKGGKSGPGAIWVSSAEDATAMVKAMARAFPARGVGRAPTGSRVKPPTQVDVAVLGSDVGKTGSGHGTWTLSKWTGADGSPEFYVNWSLTDGQGTLSEKDESQRKALLRLFAGLVG